MDTTQRIRNRTQQLAAAAKIAAVAALKEAIKAMLTVGLVAELLSHKHCCQLKYLWKS